MVAYAIIAAIFYNQDGWIPSVSVLHNHYTYMYLISTVLDGKCFIKLMQAIVTQSQENDVWCVVDEWKKIFYILLVYCTCSINVCSESSFSFKGTAMCTYMGKILNLVIYEKCKYRNLRTWFSSEVCSEIANFGEKVQVCRLKQCSWKAIASHMDATRRTQSKKSLTKRKRNQKS